jgi:NAD(P)-dependent dehydrogenase (short-subunit alcohol dehydrogenase family)
MDRAEWRDRIRREVKSLFSLSRAAVADLKPEAGCRRGLVLAATGLGGRWSPGQASDARRRGTVLHLPAQGAIAGLIKTVAREWQGVCCKAVDLDPSEEVDTLAGQVLMEMAGDDGKVQVGYHRGRRCTIECRSTPLNEPQVGRPWIEAGSVVLVTGGARGITAEVGLALARRYHPTLVLVGRSPHPGLRESSITEGLTSAPELKAALIRQKTEAGESVALPQIEAAYRRLLRDREIRENLGRIAAAGAEVRYEAVDVCDEPAMTELVRRIEREFGRLDGVIHGAGVIEDRRIEDKTPESFDRVFDTKADGAFILSRVLKPESLRFFVLFSSTAGAFGNPGQSDYAAANELLNKLARDLDGRWPGRVVAVGWGPWAKTGMVTDELRRRFEAQGVALIDAEDGCEALDRELRFGAKGQPEVILAGGSWGDTSGKNGGSLGRGASGPGEPSDPLLRVGTRVASVGGGLEIVRTIDPSYDLFLNDHRLDGKPVLPMTFALELMAEAVGRGWEDLRVVGVRDLRVLKGIVLDPGPRTVRLIARSATDPPTDRLGADVLVEITDAEGQGQPLYRATFELGDRAPEGPVWSPPPTAALQPLPRTLEQAYREWLFHGPLLQNITAIPGVGESDISGVIASSSPRGCLAGAPDGGWQIDPVVLDCGLQLVLIWSRVRQDMTPLPTGFVRYRQYDRLSTPTLTCHVQNRVLPGGHVILSNLVFLGPDGRILASVEGLEGAGSRALNRLSGSPGRSSVSAR